MRIEEAWAELHRAADLAAARGSLLFHLDLAAELAMAAFARRGIAVEGLATLVDEQGYRTFAFDAGPDRRALAEARFDARGDVDVLPPTDSPPPRATIFADAREMIAASLSGGRDGHAVVVIPADDPRKPLEGYALSAGNEAETVRASDHWLVALDPNGRRAINRQALVATTGTLPQDLNALRRTVLIVAEGVPNELHTYLSLKHDTPLIVETLASRVRWRIDGERTATC